LSAPLSNPLAAFCISGVPSLDKLRAVHLMQNELAAPFVLTEALQEEIDQAETEREGWALRLALCELIPDIPKFVSNDVKAYNRWVKAVDAKAFEIFSRLQ
jgi:hypothetical protein